MTTDSFCFYLQDRLIQTSQTGGQQYSDTSPFSIPCLVSRCTVVMLSVSCLYFYKEIKTEKLSNLLFFLPGHLCRKVRPDHRGLLPKASRS